jgi:hypothetical protein
MQMDGSVLFLLQGLNASVVITQDSATMMHVFSGMLSADSDDCLESQCHQGR